ncbi:uncharacterized protein FIBRA_00386 [Fibroporia radiculosa]|uniref:Uncharacterized protein n=1 Tax=Fibroporia radiculosa TaxID=599839 RepID=J4I7W9_9APHY|nr:uncharacterized protein FIBRA_00386 [Fibroporia radiculosa]CCL98391.1 predicted protein [Fibroporia radiculosa]
MPQVVVASTLSMSHKGSTELELESHSSHTQNIPSSALLCFDTYPLSPSHLCTPEITYLRNNMPLSDATTILNPENSPWTPEKPYVPPYLNMPPDARNIRLATAYLAALKKEYIRRFLEREPYCIPQEERDEYHNLFTKLCASVEVVAPYIVLYVCAFDDFSVKRLIAITLVVSFQKRAYEKGQPYEYLSKESLKSVLDTVEVAITLLPYPQFRNKLPSYDPFMVDVDLYIK